MTPASSHRRTRSSICALLILAIAAPALADVRFYVQREGSPDDSGFAKFADEMHDAYEETFEKFDPPHPGTPVDAILTDDVLVSLVGEWNGPYVPTLFHSSEFDQEGKIHEMALLVGFGLTIEAASDRRPLGLGFWVFDDTRAYDSAYFIEVVEANGTTWTALLENEIDLDEHGHEIEGFIGAVSDHGIERLTILAVDPKSGEPQPDHVEIDHVFVGAGVFYDPPNKITKSDYDKRERRRWRRERAREREAKRERAQWRKERREERRKRRNRDRGADQRRQRRSRNR